MKNYVKVHKGRKVPEGAVYYGDGNQCFYNANKSEFHSSVYSKWKPISCTVTARMALELPEAPQEWNGKGLPPIGCKCEVDTAESAGLSNRELEINGEEVTVIANVKNKHGYEITVFETIDGGVFCFSSKLFRPLKTQQEKDREAFIECVKQLLPKSDTDDLILSGKLFDLGFTAPKAGDNDQK